MKNKFKKINKKIVVMVFFVVIIIAFSAGKIKAEKLNISYSDIILNYTEKIYSYIYCFNGNCENKFPPAMGGGASSELFVFYGYDTNCDNFKNVCLSYDCTGLNNLECSEAKEECEQNKIIACKKNYPYGQSGTINVGGPMETYGTRMYLEGYDNFGFHWFKTGLDSPGGKAMGFKEGTRDVYFNNNVNQSGSDSNISLNNSGGLFGKIIWDEDNSIVDSEEYIKTEDKKIQFHSEDEDIMKIDSSAKYNTKIVNGLEINNTLNSEAIAWKGDTGAYHDLAWTPKLGMSTGYPDPSRENKEVLFYLDHQ